MRMSVRMVLAGACAAAALGAAAAPAFAGEIGGNGEWIEIKAKSMCAFSGLEDEPFAPGTVQNFGHVKKAFGIEGGANSVMTPFGEEGCNAHMYPMR